MRNVITHLCHLGPSKISINRTAPIAKPTTSRQSNSKFGIGLMVCAMFLFAGGDAVAKLLTHSFHPVQIIWFRQLGLFAGVIILLATRGSSVFQTRRPLLQITRGVLVVASSLLFVFAVKYAALADAIAASFVAPLIVTILGARILGERIKIQQWIAVVIGFVGAVIVVRPFMNAVHPAVMLVLIAAAFFAARQVIGRLLADEDSVATTIAYTAVTATLIISIPLPAVWVTPAHLQEWVYLLGIGVLAAAAEVLVVKALESAQASVVAPMHYTIIIWGTLYGYLLFNQLPDIWTVVGAVIIVAAGIYTLKSSTQS